MPCANSKASSEIEHVDWSTGSAAQCNNARCGSQSSQVSQSSGDICRICHCESDPQNPLLTPCYCSGSLKYVHQTCLQQWLTASETNFCELCKFPFIMHTKIKPLHEWRSLDISGIERRRLCCSALFHCAAALCVIWSLCVLIERAADDVQHGHIDWPFWTKLAVVTVGLTGGVIFMYIQCKAYLHLCHRWKARNRILLIQNAPEKINPYPQTSPRPTTQQQLQQQGQQQQQHLHSEQNNDARNAAGVIERLVNESQSNAQRNLARFNLSNASAAGLHGRDALEEKMQETDSLFRHERVPYNERLLQDLENDVDSLMAATTRSSSSNLYRTNISTGCGSGIGVPEHHAGQVAVSANIECSQSQHNYERDWALDDVVSQISSFRPCPQGSGSMTPFHDSIHNVLEHNSRTSSCVSVNEGDNESDHLAHECKSNHMPNSYDVTVSEAVPALSGSLGSSELDGFLPRQMNNVPADINNLNTNIRRHSDTKLLDEDVQYQPVIYVDMNNASSASDNEQMYRLLCQTPGAATTTTTSVDNNSTVLDMNILEGSREVAEKEAGATSSRLPQKLLAQNANNLQNLDNRNRREQHLMWQQQENNNNNRGRRIFKSLPNLSRSNENRFKK